MSKREQVSVRLPADLAKWLRRRANERHVTVSAVIEESVRRAMETDRLEILVRATLEGVARQLAGPGAGPDEARRVKLALATAAKGEMARAADGADTRPGQSLAGGQEPAQAD